jgi:hypothetical protein
MHVITRRASVRGTLLESGFVAGLEPARRPVLAMAGLRPLLTRAFSGGGPPAMLQARQAGPAPRSGAGTAGAAQRR